MLCLTLTAEEILNINETNPERLYSFIDYKLEYNKLRSKWHPDKGGDYKVATHVKKLYIEAKHRAENNLWNGPAELVFTTTTDQTYRFEYRKVHKFELGHMYIALSKIAFFIDAEYQDLFDNGMRFIKGIRYPDTRFETEFKKSVPNVLLQAKMTDGRCVVVMEKAPDTILLQDVIDYLPNNMIDPKHTAWIIGSLCNMNVFFEWMDICHNSILPSTVFISPSEHYIQILGGWWYASKPNTKPLAIPSKLTSVLPPSFFVDKLALTQYDRLAAKATAIGCLGDKSLNGSKLLMNPDIPKAMLHWVRSPSTTSAHKEYQSWEKALHESFGPRKFVVLDVDPQQVYQQ